MNCEICFEFYNKDARRLMTILPCTHTFCSRCLNEIKKVKYKCPKCKKNITNEIPCYALLNILDNIAINNDANLELKQNIYDQLNGIKEIQEQLRSGCEYKLENVSNEISLIKTEINKRASKLISLIKINREKLLYEADCIQSNLSDLLLESLLVIQDIKLEAHNINLMKRNQLKGLKDELIRYKSELTYKINQLNEIAFNYEFEPNRDINYNKSLIGDIGFKTKIVSGSNKICSMFDCQTDVNIRYFYFLFLLIDILLNLRIIIWMAIK